MSSAALAIDPTVARPARRLDAGRLDLLDGVRGWCALSVVFFHLFWETFGVVAPGFRNPVAGFFFDGQLAVCIFFVLSGEALSSTFFAGKGDTATFRLAIKRYPRLATPILVTCMIAWALDASGLVFAAGAAKATPIARWIGDWPGEPLTFAYALRYSLVDVFVSANQGRAVNPMLWTMPIELLGSFLVFAIVLLWNRLARPRTLLFALFVAASTMPAGSIANYLSCFFAGVAFAEWRVHGLFDRIGARFAPAVWTAIAVLAAADGTLHWRGAEQGRAVIAVALMFAVYASPRLCAFLSGGVSRALGRISFPLYLVQFPVLVSFTCWLIVQADAVGTPSLFAVWAISLASVAVCLLAAWAFAPVEGAARNLGDWLIRLGVWARGRLAIDASTPP